MVADSKKTILVTGIGGNVGQGILRVLRQHFPMFHLVGTDTGTLTAGHHFCDTFYSVPFSYEPAYAEVMIKICRLERVDLIIPSTDYEVFYLGLIEDKLPQLVVSPPETAQIFIDKLKTYQVFKSLGLSFARSWLPGEYRDECPQIIVKPREGRGSRGLHINPANPGLFDETFMVQELHSGPEITTAFYVNKKARLHGMMTFERSLASGMTERCQITHDFDEPLTYLVEQMVEKFDLRGPCNIQSIVNEEGRIVPFEVNCRYSGTSSIRAQLGFPDVVFGVEEYLLSKELSTPSPNISGSAVRIYMDIIYPDCKLDAIDPGTGNSYVF
jgi:carbamoyl-phosphate synthase large subunit